MARCSGIAFGLNGADVIAYSQICETISYGLTAEDEKSRLKVGMPDVVDYVVRLREERSIPLHNVHDVLASGFWELT